MLHYIKNFIFVSDQSTSPSTDCRNQPWDLQKNTEIKIYQL